MLDKVLFQIGSFEVTVLVVVLAALLIVLLVAAIAFRQNYIIQVRLSRLMDAESAKHNHEGFITLLRKRKKKILKNSRQVSPAIVIFSLDNLGGIYVGYKNQRLLMRTISDVFTEGLTKQEFVTRIDFSKFGLIVTDRNREEVKEFILKCIERLNETEFPNYGYYTFDVTCAVYEAVPLENPKDEVALAIHTLKYAVVKDGNIYYYSQDVLDKVNKLEEINASKETAMEAGLIIPYVQPKVDFKTGKVVGGEVLVRWINDDGSIKYYPDEFIPLFESNGYIRQIDLKMFEATCIILQNARNTGHDIVVSTNFSKLTLNSLRKIDPLLEITTKYGVNPSSIEIEITESEFVSTNQAFTASILRLRQAGFRIAMDDFGKEYSSLSLLTENRFDTIKVDKFFFENSLATDKEKNVAKNIINLLSSVGCKICLEGIETLTCLDYLATVNRQVLLQGYYFSKPIPEVKFEQFLDTVFPFNYPVDSDKPKPQVIIQTVEVEKKVEEQPDASGDTTNHTTINVTTNAQNEALDSLKAQMAEMQKKFEQQLQEQRDLTHKRDMELMQQQLEFIKKTQEMQAKNKPVELETQLIDNREDDRVRRLKEQLDELERERERERRERDRERDRDRDSYRDRRDYDDLQQQIRDLRNQQNNNNNGPVYAQPMGYPYPYPPYAPYPYPYPYPQQQPQQNIDVDALIDKLSKKQKEQVDSAMDEMKAQNQSLQDRLDAERKEREELEAMLKDIQAKAEEEEVSEEEQEREQEEADKALTLDVDALPVDDKDDDSEDDDSDDADTDEDSDSDTDTEEPVEKSELTLEQIEALVKNYQDRFQEDWMSHAKEELQGGFDELVKGLRFYKLQNAERKTFVDKVKKLSPEVKQIYNIVKNEFMKYNGVTNKLTNSCDVLYKGRNQIAKINFTKSKVRLYLGLDPNNEEYQKIPHKDLSSKRAHARTPFYMLLKSPLSVKRAKKLIADLMVMHNCEENLNYKPIDYATKYKFFKKDQKK